jgi:hypothetical protein
VLVIDGSDPAVYRLHRAAFTGLGHHLQLDRDLRSSNGKVDGVTTGLRHASHEAVVVADEDVRYDRLGLQRVEALLGDTDLVVPQNVFMAPLPWHARWDGARSLLNRAFGTDYPGTMGVRRSMFLAMGGYDGDVLFENLELIRTMRAWGGRVTTAPDLIVPRRAPSFDIFLEQRIRQAYDDLAQPPRLVASLLVAPLVAAAIVRRDLRALLGAAGVVIGLAELGRRRHAPTGGGFPRSTPLFAPAWVLERALCSWLAVGTRVTRGGITYRGTVIRRAATSTRELRRRAAMRRAGQLDAAGESVAVATA